MKTVHSSLDRPDVELLVLQGRLVSLSRREAPTRTAELLDSVDLNDAANRRIRSYSGGMKRRLDLASALVHGPRVLFLTIDHRLHLWAHSGSLLTFVALGKPAQPGLCRGGR